jgi:hypothetical protein
VESKHQIIALFTPLTMIVHSAVSLPGVLRRILQNQFQANRLLTHTQQQPARSPRAGLRVVLRIL